MSKRKLLKAYPFLAELDSYHVEVANILYKLRPHWLSYAKIDEFKGQKYFAVELLSPAHPEEWRVLIYTDNFEITVAWFNSWHGHFTRGNFPKEQALIKILSYLDDIINEREVVVFRNTYDQWNSKKGRFYSRDEIQVVLERHLRQKFEGRELINTGRQGDIPLHFSLCSRCPLWLAIVLL